MFANDNHNSKLSKRKNSDIFLTSVWLLNKKINIALTFSHSAFLTVKSSSQYRDIFPCCSFELLCLPNVYMFHYMIRALGKYGLYEQQLFKLVFVRTS